MARVMRKRSVDFREVIQTQPGGPLAAGGSIIPSPGPAPTVTPMTDPIVHTGPYTVATGTTVYATSLAYLFESGSPNSWLFLVSKGGRVSRLVTFTFTMTSMYHTVTGLFRTIHLIRMNRAI